MMRNAMYFPVELVRCSSDHLALLAYVNYVVLIELMVDDILRLAAKLHNEAPQDTYLECSVYSDRSSMLDIAREAIHWQEVDRFVPVDCPKVLKELAGRCCRKDPKSRPSFKELQSEL